MELKRIAVVDDDEGILKILHKVFSKAGYEVLTLSRSVEAMEALLRFRPHLAFIDLMMPGIDGITLCGQIKASQELSSTKVIIFSAKKFLADRRTAQQMGADAYFEKPFHYRDLLEKARSILLEQIRVRFWGVRGSIPTPSPRHVLYGGNTPCIQVRIPDRESVLIFDAGTGIRNLGHFLLSKRRSWHGHLFLTHLHWDHIHGIPFFDPAYLTGNGFMILGPDPPKGSLQEAIEIQMSTPYFPVGLQDMGAQLTFRSITEGDHMVDGLEISCIAANHPGSTLMYRLRHQGCRLIYAPDNEIEPRGKGGMDPMAGAREKMRSFFEGSDLLIHDAQYLPDEYDKRRGWGHSSWTEVVEMASQANVRRLILFHHDQHHGDEDLDALSESCQAYLYERRIAMTASVAREGEELLV